MSCKNYGFNLNPSRLKDVDYVAKGNEQKATILAMWLSGQDGFVEYVNSLQDPLWKGIEKTNSNTIRKLLSQYWRQRFPSISDFYTTKDGMNTYGFDTISASITAKNYIADLISELLEDNTIDKSKLFINLAQRVISRLNKDILNNIVSSSKFEDKKEEYYNKMSNWANIINNPNSTQEEKNKARTERTRYVYSIIDSYGSYTQKNYAILSKLIRSQNKEFIDYVYTSYKLRNVSKGVLNGNENYEIEDINNEDEIYINQDADVVDEMMRQHGRDSTMKRDFTEIGNRDLKYYFNSIYKLVDAKSKTLDRNNELGVPTKMNYTYIIHTLLNNANFNSIPEFIESIRDIALKQSRNAGLIKVYEDIKNNSFLANLIYSQLHKPFIIKSIIDNNNGEVSIARSNRDADVKIHLFNDNLNSIKTKLRKEVIKSYNGVLNNIIENLSYLKDLDENNKDYNDLYNDCILRLKDVLSYFFNNITNEDIDNYLNYGNKIEVIRNLINKLQNILNEGEIISNNFSKAYSEYRRKLNDYNFAKESGIDINKPSSPDYDSYFTSAFYKALNSFTEILVDYTYIKNNLNSADSSGNLGSDVIANNWLTTFNSQINYRTETNINAGIFQLLKFYAKSEHNRKNSILFDQIVDGVLVSKGMGRLHEDGHITINENAKDIFVITLFNGIRNSNGSSSNYENMSNVDYLVSMLTAFHKVSGVVEDAKTTKELAGYFLRTPSDAPKNFILYTKKINTDGLYNVNSEYVDKYLENWITNNIIFTSKFTSPVNKINKEQLTNYLKELPKSIYLFTGNKFITDKNNITTINFEYIDNNKNKIIISFSGIKVNNKLQNIAQNKIIIIGNKISEDVKEIIFRPIVNNAIKIGEIKRFVNKNSIAFKAIKNQVIREIEDGFRALINISDYTTDINGETKIKVKKDLSSYSDNYYRKGDKIIENGRLVGNAFQRYVLFEVNGYNAGKELERIFPFYGGTTLSPIWKNNGDNTFSLNLNEEQIKNLEDIVSSWIENYLIDCNKYYSQYSSIIDPLFSINEVEDFFINYFLTSLNMDDILEGNAKYYKNIQDLFKRNKEVQAGGQSYGNPNFDSAIGEDIKEIDKLQIPRKGGIASPITIPISTGWKAVTIKNTNRASRTTSQMREYLTDIITKNKKKELNVSELSDEYKAIVKITVDSIVGGFEEKTKTNDAQSYITIEEFVRRHYLDGTYYKYKDLIEQLIDPNTKEEDINYTELYNFIQAQKNFYFDHFYDTVDGEIKPRQIKNAEFVLIPALLPETSGLRSLYDSMKKYNISQVNTVETDKAAKREILEFFDNNGEVTKDNKRIFDEKLSKGIGVENYYYKYLYKQQEVPQHIKDARNKLAVQLSKKIFNNYKTSTPVVKKAINDFQNAYVAKIKKAFNKTIKKLNIKLNEDGSVKSKNGIINVDQFYKVAREEASRLDVSSDFIKYLTTDNMGSPIMPNWMNSVSMKIESICQSVFNRGITRQTMPGWHAAQVSNIGYDNNLEYHPSVKDENGNIIHNAYMEIYLPRWSSLIPEDMKADELPEDLQFQIAYRIPTEGKQSIITIKVKGFLPDAYGSTIIVPEEWVTQTGSDFDIDSVYGVCHNIRSKKKYEFKDGSLLNRKDAVEKVGDLTALNNMINFGEIKEKTILFKHDYIEGNNEENIKNRYDRYIKYEDKTVSLEEFKTWSIDDQNTTEALENRMVDSFITIMQDDSSIEEHLGRSNYDDLNSAKIKIENILPKNQYADSPYSFISQIINRDKAQSGATLKAFSVNRDQFLSLTNVGQAVLSSPITVIYNTENESYNIEIIKESYDKIKTNDKKIIVVHDKYGWSKNNKNVVGKILTSYSSQTTAHILDAVKVGSLFNENKYTFGSFKTLIDLGIDYFTAELFLATKGVSRIVSAYNSIQSEFGEGFGKPYDLAMKQLAIENNLTTKNRELITETSSIKDVYEALELRTGIIIPKTIEELKEYNIILDQDSLIEGLNTEDINLQLEEIIQFIKLYNITSDIENIATLTSPDKFGAKQDVKSTRNILTNIYTYRKNDILTVEDKTFIDALYPIDKNGNIIEEKSFYPYIASFLKRSTKLSVDVNSKILTLESDNIYNLIKYIEKLHGFRFTDEQYKDFQKYMVSYLYNMIGIVTEPQTIDDKNKFITNTKLLVSEDNIYKQWSNEYLRIKGYTANETININISDIVKPTQEDVDNFSKLTPVQKIIFIKNAFKYDLGIFEFIKTNSFNQKEFKEKGSSGQYLTFNDKTENIDNIHQLFNKAAFSSNPLIRLAILDLVKYSFVVEGGRFKRNSIGKLITSEFLLSSIYRKGTGIANEGIEKMSKIFNISDFVNNGKTTDLFEKYIRQNPEIIKLVKLPSDSEFKILFKDEIIEVLPDELGSKFMDYIGGYVNLSEDDKRIKPYIRAQIGNGKNRKTVLYKSRVISNSNIIYYYPLNLLDKNEVLDYSINNNNNIYKTEEYYIDTIYKADDSNIPIQTLLKNDKKGKIDKLISSKRAISSNDRTIIQTNASRGIFSPAYIISNKLKDKSIGESVIVGIHLNIANGKIINNIIPNTGDITIQEIGDTPAFTGEQQMLQTYLISRKANSNKLKEAFKIGKENNIEAGRNILKDDSDLLNIYNDSIVDGELVSKNSPILIEVSKIYPVKEETSSVEELAASTNDIDTSFIELDSTMSDIDRLALDIYTDIKRKKDKEKRYEQYFNNLKKVGVSSYTVEGLRNSTKTIFSKAANLYPLVVRDLIKQVDNFENTGYSLSDERLYIEAANNPILLEKLNNYILNCCTLGNSFGGIFNFDVSSLDSTLTKQIEVIKKAINEIKSNTDIKNAIKKLIDITFKQYSDNPLIKDGILKLSEQFGDADLFDSLFSDIHELNSSEIQTIIKYVEKVHEVITQVVIPEQIKAMKDKIAEYRKKGINVDKLIKNGKWRSNYNDKFIKDKKHIDDKLRDTLFVYGEFSEEYQKAYLEKERWYTENVIRQIDNDYYTRRLIQLERVINKALKEYIEYKRLRKEIADINNFDDGELSDEQLELRKKLAIKLRQLLSELNSNGTPKTDEEIERINVVKQFNRTISELNDQYFESIAEEGFEDILQHKLDIIKDYDEHHKNYTLEEKLKDKEYLDAYTWIQINTVFDVDKDIKQKVFQAFKDLGTKYDAKDFFKVYIAKHPEIVDENGIIDGRKISSEAIKQLKELFEDRYSKDSDTPFVTPMRRDLIMDENIPKPNQLFWASLGAIKKTAYNEELDNIHKAINEILDKCIDEEGHISSEKLFNLGDDVVKELAELYSTEINLKESIERDSVWSKKFVQSVEFKYNNASFMKQFNWALTNLSGEKLALWKQIFAEKKGSSFIPNSNIYGYFVPKDSKYIDNKRENALKTIKDNVEFVKTKYYYEALNRAIELDKNDLGYYQKWFNENHIYNSFTDKYEPLNIWTELRYKNNPSTDSPYKYKPVGDFVRSEVKKEYKNDKYRKNAANFNNKNDKYKSAEKLTDNEIEAVEYFKNIMRTYFSDDRNIRFINQDKIPRVRKREFNSKQIIKQLAGIAGISANSSPSEWKDDIGYEYDIPADFNMFEEIKNKNTKERIKYRKQFEGESREEYVKYLNKTRKENEKIDAENEILSNAISENNVEAIFEEFIRRAVEYNSKERQKNILYMLLEDLKRNKAYKLTGVNQRLRRDKFKSIENNNEYVKEEQKRNIELLENYIRRFIYDEYKEPHALNKFASFLQNYTSAKYMTLNATGGVTNILTGLVNIWGEQFAKNYFNTSDIIRAEKDYLSSIPQILSGMYDDKGRNIIDAFIKRMNVVDFDKVLERSSDEDLGKYAERIKNYLYSMQSIGEHFMQNVVLIAMTKSHRIFKNDKGNYVIGSYAQYIREIEKQTLRTLLADNEILLRDYNQFVIEQQKDINKLKEYAEFKEDFNEKFLRIYCDKQIQKEYIKLKKENLKKAKEEFNNDSIYPTIFSQVEYKNGECVIKDESNLTNEMLAELKLKTISVNKKIHGVYDKIGAAQLEKKWFGPLLMQYHKHLYPGIMKRFRIRGYFNEFRNSTEKGSYISLYKFLSIEFKNYKNKNKEDKTITALEGIQNIFKATINTFANWNFNYNLLPEWEQANIRRLKGDLAGLIGGFMLLLLLRGAGEDDDEIMDSNMYNFGLYIADRWFTESNAMTPWGLFTEAKSLYSQPIPSYATMNDVMKLMDLTTKYLFDEDFDPTYKTGKYKDENKFIRLLINNTPINRNIERIGTMNKHNQYYKFDDNSMRNAIIDNVIEYATGD